MTVVKMSEVAARAGVSQATVSFVLGGRAERLKISDSTRQRVLTVARELGYQRNQLARAMITGKSRILGLLTSPEEGANVVRILTGAMEAASDAGYLLKVIHLSYDGVDDSTIARCMEWRLAGAMAVGLSDESLRRLNREFRAKGIAMAIIDTAPVVDWGIHIHSDDDQGLREVVSHLVALGHRRIAFLGGSASYLSDLREKSFRMALTEAGLPVSDHWVRQTDWYDQGVIEQEVTAMFQASGISRPSAVVCSADTIAMVVQRIARASGLRLPEDLSITGYSNDALAAYADPPLTSVDQSFQGMGHAAVLHLIRDAERDDPGKNNGVSSDLLIPTRLIVRNSTAAAPLLLRY